MKKWALYSILGLFTGISACDTDFDVNQNWTEIPVIYGLLNSTDSVSYIRVQKAFLGDGDAFVFAGNSDSIYYSDVLNVKLEEWKNGVFQDSTLLVRDSTVIKDTGLFANNAHVLYKTDNAFQIDEESEYRLEVKNISTAKIATSSTQIVEKIIVSRPPQATTAKIRLTGNFPYTVNWLSAENGKIYELVIRFFYVEENKVTLQREVKNVDWFFPSKVVSNPSSPTSLEIEIASGSFYTFLASQLDEDLTVNRYYCHLDFMFSVGAEDLFTYVQVNEPPIGIVQEKPQFTNIEGGLGIFSSRNNFTVENKELDSESSSELLLGTTTQHLGFIGRSINCQ